MLQVSGIQGKEGRKEATSGLEGIIVLTNHSSVVVHFAVDPVVADQLLRLNCLLMDPVPVYPLDHYLS